MKRIQLWMLLVIGSLTQHIWAVPADPTPREYTQPDGTVITIRLRGDEFCHWTETSNGLIVKKAPDNFYYYAQLSGDAITLTSTKANDSKLTSQELSLYKAERQKIAAKLEQTAYEAKQVWLNDSQETTAPAKAKKAVNTTGTNRVICILMDFPDRPFTRTKSEFENLYNRRNYRYDYGNGHATGSVKDFYLENSYNQLTVEATVVGPYRAKKNAAYYAYNGDIASSNIRELIKEAVNAANGDVDFKNFDCNGDNYVDVVHVVFSGHGAEWDETGNIWSHQWELQTAILRDSRWIKQYICTPELAGDVVNRLASIGTICHEYGHALGAPDFYDTNKSNPDYPGTGSWDVMCDSHLDGGRTPAHHNPYTKAYIFNWGTVQTISGTTAEYTLFPSNQSNVFYRINTSTAGEYFLLENRAKLGFNTKIPGSAGLLVYHIHKDIGACSSTNTVNTSHPQKCYIVNPHSTSRLPTDKPSSYTANISSWTYPNNGEKIFLTPNTIPSLMAWNGTPVNMDICFIRREGNNIKFNINPKISGPTTVCDSAWFSIPYLPSLATIKWRQTSSSLTSTGPGAVKFPHGKTSEEIMIARGVKYVKPMDSIQLPDTMILMKSSPLANSDFTTIPFSGDATIQAVTTSGGYSYTMKKTITFPKLIHPIVADINGTWFLNTSRTLTAERPASNADNEIMWHITMPDGAYSTHYGRSVTLKPTTIGTLTATLVDLKGCPTTNTTTETYTITRRAIRFTCQSPIQNGQLVAGIEEEEDVVTESNAILMASSQNNTANFTIQIWHTQLGLVKEVNNCQLHTNSIDVSNLPNGIYQLILLQNSEIISTIKTIKL